MVGSLVHHPLTLSPLALLLAVFLLPALEASIFVGVVVPGETAVVIGGFLAHSGSLEPASGGARSSHGGHSW
jgi:membrane-associated protein